MMMYKIVKKLTKSQISLVLYITSRKPMRCTGKLLKIRSKLILIHFTSFVEHIYIYIFFLFFFVVRNVVGKINKETL
jgi:hypothetical protein